MIQRNSYCEVMYPSLNPLLCDPFEASTEEKTDPEVSKASHCTVLSFYFLSPFCPHGHVSWVSGGAYTLLPPPQPLVPRPRLLSFDSD